jgi:hypothetical protein
VVQIFSENLLLLPFVAICRLSPWIEVFYLILSNLFSHLEEIPKIPVPPSNPFLSNNTAKNPFLVGNDTSRSVFTGNDGNGNAAPRPVFTGNDSAKSFFAGNGSNEQLDPNQVFF